MCIIKCYLVVHICIGQSMNKERNNKNKIGSISRPISKAAVSLCPFLIPQFNGRKPLNPKEC
jgi:hypothetical protein